MSTKTDWIELQKKTFTKWINQHLTQRSMDVEDLYHDLSDGVKLINLLEIISEEQVCAAYNKKPKMRIHMLENVGQALKFMTENKKIRLVNIGSSDIVDSQEKIILALIWNIILHFQVQTIEIDGISGKQGLLLWCKRSVEKYEDIKIDDFTNSWKDGRALCGIISRYRSDVLDYEEYKEKSPEERLESAINSAHEKLDIKPLMEPADFLGEGIDEKSVITYVSEYFKKFSDMNKQESLIKCINGAVEVSRKHEQFKTDYINGMKDLTNWINSIKQNYSIPSNQPIGKSLDDITSLQKELNSYYHESKPYRSSQLMELHRTFTNYISSIKINNRPEFIPPEEYQYETVSKQFNELEPIEKEYEKRLIKERIRFQKLDYNISKFNQKASQVESFINEKLLSFQNPDLGNTVTEIETRLDSLNSTYELMERMKSIIGEMSHLLNDITNEHKDYDGCVLKLKQIENNYKGLCDVAAEYKKKLENALKEQQTLIELQSKYNKNGFKYLCILDDIEEQISEPINDDSIEAIDKMINTLSQASLFTEADSIMKELHEESKIITLHHKENFLSIYPMETLEMGQQRVKDKLNNKLKELKELLESERHKDSLKKQFAEVAIKITNLVNEKSKQISSITSSTNTTPLEDQLKQIEQLQSEYNNDKSMLTEAENLDNQLQELKVIMNPYTSENIFSLSSLWNELGKLYMETVNEISQSMNKHNVGLTDEQIKEIREVFNFFDEDHDGKLNEDEFYSCLTGIGLKASHAEAKQYMRDVDKENVGYVELDGFLRFMVGQLTHKETLEDVSGAFNSLSNNNDVIPTNTLKSLFGDSENLKYMLTKVEDNDGAWNWKEFTSQLFQI